MGIRGQIANQVKRRLGPTETSLRYLKAGSGTIRYLGWLGQRNLGDEAVHQALETYLEPYPLSWRPERVPNSLAGRVENVNHRFTVVGGGTLIGGRYVDQLELESDRQRRAVFGAGVIDPEFPHSYRQGVESLDRWVEAIDGIALLGVRGPRSQELLSERGIDAPILGDPVAGFVQPDGHWSPRSGRTIGINVGQSGGAVWGSELTMLAAMADTVRGLAAGGWDVEYFVVWPEDLAVTRMFARDTGTQAAPVHCIYDRADEFVNRVSHLNAFVGLKLHAVALAICAGVPSVSIEYHPKCRDFMASLDLDRLAIRSDALGSGALDDLVEELIDGGETISAHGRKHLVEFRREQQAAIDGLDLDG